MEEKKSAALALVPNQPASAMTVTGNIRISSMNEAIALAERLSSARGFVPSSLAGNGAAVLAAILTGAELGMGPMEAMRSLHIIEGKPTMSSETMLARAHRAGHRTKWLRTDTECATLSVTLAGQTQPEAPISFTMEDAKRAGVAGKGNWSKFPAQMLRARAASGAIRAHCPEVLGAGVYESESGELTGGIPSAEVISVQTIPAAAQEAKPRPLPSKPEQCINAAELEAFARKHHKSITEKRERVLKIVARAAEFDVPATTVDAWLGMDVQTGEVIPAHDPGAGEVPPDQEPA